MSGLFVFGGRAGPAIAQDNAVTSSGAGAAEVRPWSTETDENDAREIARRQYHRYYFDEQRPLALAVEEIAVFQATEGPAREPPDILPEFGIAAADVIASPIAGWSITRTPEGSRDAEGIEELVAGIALDPRLDFVSPVFVGDDGGPVIVTRDILVGFHRHVGAARAQAILAGSDAGRIIDADWTGMKGVYRLRSDSANGFEVLAAANALAVRPQVRFAEPDMIFTGHATETWPDDPIFSSLWGIHNAGSYPDMDMDGPQAWDITAGDPSVTVVIIDTGVQLDHPDLNIDPVNPGIDTTTDAGDGGPVNACDNHGTAVAGCVSAIMNNGTGVTGIAPGCVSASARTFISNLSCNGSWFSVASWTVDSLDWAQSSGARATVNSNGYGFTSAAIEAKYQDTHDRAQIVHFAAAGNASSPSLAYPASIEVVNACAALAQDGNLWPSSNYGVGLAFSAPGQTIWLTDRTGVDGWSSSDYTFGSGTSYATPYAAGVAALIISQSPSLTAAEVEVRMQQTCMDLGAAGYDTIFGWGFVNACAALTGSDCPDTCGAGAGPCDQPHGGQGCDQAGCCTYVCLLDPLCCDQAWDQSCADVAVDACSAVFPGTTTRVSLDSSGNEASEVTSLARIAAATPNLVAFETAAAMVPEDTNSSVDVFVRDTAANQTEQVSIGSGGEQGNDDSWLGSISPDSRWIAMHTWAATIVPGDSNLKSDVIVRDRLANNTTLVSVSSAGVQGNGDSYRPAITPDGRFVAFSSDASNLVSGDTNGVRDFFVHDRDPDENGVYDEPGLIETTRVNVSSSGAQADDASGIGTGDLCPAISDDGRYVAFYSLASNLVPFDENGTWDVFVHDRETMQTVRVSISAAGAEGNRSSALPQMTGDGRYVVYRSHADNLAANDTNGLRDIFLHDRDSDADEIYDEPGAIETRLISVNSAGALSNGHSNNPDISSDGRFVSYNSSSSNLVPVDFNYYTDVFVHDRATGETSLVSVGTEELSNGGSQRASISATGQHIAFRSVATNLVPDDTNGLRDGFVRDRGPISPPCPCDCEAPPDGTVDVGDFLALLAQWGNPGTCDCEDPPDGVVDVGDFLAILAAWGTCP